MASPQDKIREKTASQLRAGEQVQAAFGAQTASNYWLLAAGVGFYIVNEFRCVVVTDQRILVFNSGKLSFSSPKELIAELPRSTRIGPPKGAFWYTTDSLGESLRIHKRFHKDVEQADAQIAAPQPAAPQPA
ncbi:MAG: hypothetical protein U0R24_10700 [Solirubrobacterales bacterium]